MGVDNGRDRALDKREYLVIIRDNFCLFCTKFYVVTPHLNRLYETVQIRGHRDGSDEGSQHMISMRNKKNFLSVIINTPLIDLKILPLSQER